MVESAFLLEAPPRFELGIKVLQTSALPLGYGADSDIIGDICVFVNRLFQGGHNLLPSTCHRWIKFAFRSLHLSYYDVLINKYHVFLYILSYKNKKRKTLTFITEYGILFSELPEKGNPSAASCTPATGT